MKKKMDLKTFSVYHYLKEQYRQYADIPFFLADQDTYKNASIRFPFRTFTYGIGLTYSGEGERFRIGSRDYTLQAGTLSTVGPGIVCQWKGAYSGQHDTVYFTDEFFKDTLKSSFLKSLPFFLPGGNHVILLDDMRREQVKSLFQTLKQFKDDPNVITGILHSLLMLVVQCHEIQSAKPERSYSIGEKNVSDFKRLLSKHFLEHKEVSFYASALNMTPKHLSEILLQETGKPAKAIILDHLLMEAKSLLRQTDMSVQEIAYWLGYEDTSYFTRAFRKQEIITPLAYRKL